MRLRTLKSTNGSEGASLHMTTLRRFGYGHSMFNNGHTECEIAAKFPGTGLAPFLLYKLIGIKKIRIWSEKI